MPSFLWKTAGMSQGRKKEKTQSQTERCCFWNIPPRLLLLLFFCHWLCSLSLPRSLSFSCLSATSILALGRFFHPLLSHPSALPFLNPTYPLLRLPPEQTLWLLVEARFFFSADAKKMNSPKRFRLTLQAIYKWAQIAFKAVFDLSCQQLRSPCFEVATLILYSFVKHVIKLV